MVCWNFLLRNVKLGCFVRMWLAWLGWFSCQSQWHRTVQLRYKSVLRKRQRGKNKNNQTTCKTTCNKHGQHGQHARNNQNHFTEPFKKEAMSKQLECIFRYYTVLRHVLIHHANLNVQCLVSTLFQDHCNEVLQVSNPHQWMMRNRQTLRFCCTKIGGIKLALPRTLQGKEHFLQFPTTLIPRTAADVASSGRVAGKMHLCGAGDQTDKQKANGRVSQHFTK